MLTPFSFERGLYVCAFLFFFFVCFCFYFYQEVWEHQHSTAELNSSNNDKQIKLFKNCLVNGGV